MAEQLSSWRSIRIQLFENLQPGLQEVLCRVVIGPNVALVYSITPTVLPIIIRIRDFCGVGDGPVPDLNLMNRVVFSVTQERRATIVLQLCYLIFHDIF